ncbi:RNA 2',3'-cyclic phosphodiesterase [Hyphobacterium sp.]|uniref:RNA 2',3'-cyclic phosphodiesterase n=1 Tax=Hyphobacterium sp. TaxID=2004662 RepID=UPI003BA955BC
MSLRLFAALPVPTPLADRLTGLQKGVPSAIWRPASAMHITLRFFGEIDEAKAEELDFELGQIRCKPFDLAIKGAGSFGRSEPHAIWMGIEAHPSLILLAKACSRAARRTGLTHEKRAYIPHVTMAYLGQTDLDRVNAFEHRHALYRSPVWTADRFYLYSSWQGGRGDNPYQIEAEYPLTG